MGMLRSFFLSAGAVADVSGVLALLLVIADATIANYGEITITINEKKELKVRGGASLLSTLMGQGIFIPSACGGRGSCGLCKAKVIKGAGQYLPKEIEFTAGHFIQFMAPGYELTEEPVYRAYSVASPPSIKNRIELEIRLVPDGICTTYVHKYLKAGDEVLFNGPYGEFYLRESGREIFFIAGGSGMAPIKAILMDMADRGINRKTRYFFGARSKKDLFLLGEMKKLEERLEDFKFIPALSDPQPEDNWDGETGLITDVVSNSLKSGENVEAYLCGSPGMINACVKVLTERGVPEERIFYDKFG